MTNLVSLAEHNRGNSKLNSKTESLVRKDLMNGLKDFDNLLKANESLPLNLSDFYIFASLGCLLD